MPTCSPTIYASLHTCPNEDAAIAAASLFAAITLASLIITLKTRCWFVLFVPLTGALEAVGYGLRVSFVREPTFISLVIMQCCIIVSPVLLAIVDYVCLGRVIALADSQRVPIALRRFAPWIGRAFTLSDVLCLALQGFGGGMLVSEDAATQELGTRVLLVGILLQVVFFTLFLAITVYVQRSSTLGLGCQPALKPVFFCLLSTIGLMYARNIFRAVESFQGFHGYLASHEEFLYTLDFMLIYMVFIAFTAMHFGFHLPRGDQQSPASGAGLAHQKAKGQGGDPRVISDLEMALGVPVTSQSEGSHAGDCHSTQSAGGGCIIGRAGFTVVPFQPQPH